jgi:hypothetical protein
MDIDFTSRTGESQKRSVAMGLADAAAKRVNEMNAMRSNEMDAANKYAEENGDAFANYDSLSSRGGKFKRTAKRSKSRKSKAKRRKSRKNRGKGRK